MADTFNVNEYWLKRGHSYFKEGRPEEFHQLQEEFLLKVLQDSQIAMGNILELGCGFGRITKRLSEAFPESRITAVDLSSDQLEHARGFCGENKNVAFQQYDFYSGKPIPGGPYDTVIAVEVFLHHPRPLVRNIFEKLAGIAAHVVNIDWSEDWPWETPEHVWVHDFASVYSDAGLRCVCFALPGKIEGMQQKLFIASRKLEPSLIHLERQVERSQKAKGPAGGESEPESEVVHWPKQLGSAIKELRRTLAMGTTFILVNNDEWGNESRALAGYKVIPFLEHDGQYWGPPADDRTALRELERLQGLGATHIVFAWSAFWWLDYYAGFCRFLRETCPVLLENERLIIFELVSDASAANFHVQTHA